MTRGRRLARAASMAALVLVSAVAAACGNDSSTATSPTSTTTATTVAEPTITESYTATIPVGGSGFYSFTVLQNGTVNVTLSSVGGAGVPSTIWLGLGTGTPSGEDCTTSATVNTAAGTAVHLTNTSAPGVYCVRVWDIGNLAAPATIAVTIAHP